MKQIELKNIPDEIGPMTICQAFQAKEVICVGREHSRSAVKLGRRRRTSQNLGLILEIQTVDF